MQAAIDGVMHTYGMLVNLTVEQEKLAREKVASGQRQNRGRDPTGSRGTSLIAPTFME